MNVQVPWCTYWCRSQRTTCRSWLSASPPLRVDPRDGTQVIRFGDKHLYMPKHLTDPRNLIVLTITAFVLTKSSEFLMFLS